MSERWECAECDWIGPSGECVQVNVVRDDGTCVPFVLCPNCLSVDTTLLRLRDVEGCNVISSCGTPTLGGYAVTCSKHVPKASHD